MLSIYIVAIFVGTIGIIVISLPHLGNLIRFALYGSTPDPIEDAVSEALGNRNLVLNSKLNLWIDALGEPDMTFTFYCRCYDGIYFGWLDRGVAVTTRTSKCNARELDRKQHGELKVAAIIIPITKEVHARYPTKDKKFTVVKFAKLLDVRIKGKRLSEMTFNEIDSLYYYHYDSSEYGIYLHKYNEFITRVMIEIQYSKPIMEKGNDGDWDKDIEQIIVF